MVTCLRADLLAKCTGVTDPTLAAAVDKIRKIISACQCGLKYKELTDKVAEQTATAGASDTCATEMQKIIKGTVCVLRNVLAYVRKLCTYLCTLWHILKYSCVIVIILSFSRPPPSPNHARQQQHTRVCCCTDLALVCKDVDDQETRKQIISMKMDSENKCGTNVGPVNASSLSGKAPLFVSAKNC